MAIPSGTPRPVAVTGASGFVGRRLIHHLRNYGHSIRGIVRSLRDVEALHAMGCEAARADVRDPASLRTAFAGVRAVVHLVAILREHGDETFDAVNHLGAGNVATAAREAGADRIVHLSAVGADPQARRYLRSKWMGEQAVRASGLPAVIFRASILIGPGGGAAAQFADVVRFGPWYPLVLQFGGRGFFGPLASLAPLVPVLGAGGYRLMPVALDDVLPALVVSIDRPDVGGQVFEIGGPQVLTYNEIVDATARVLGLRRRRLHLPAWAARAVVRAFSVLPNPPITEDEAQALFEENLCDNAAALRTFDLQLRPFEVAMREAILIPRAKE
jgi:NADH dehydrogenase